MIYYMMLLMLCFNMNMNMNHMNVTLCTMSHLWLLILVRLFSEWWGSDPDCLWFIQTQRQLTNWFAYLILTERPFVWGAGRGKAWLTKLELQESCAKGNDNEDAVLPPHENSGRMNGRHMLRKLLWKQFKIVCADGLLDWSLKWWFDFLMCASSLWILRAVVNQQ